jgi:hypothetical protein
VKCSATTATGRPCRALAMQGSERCVFHQGSRVGRQTLLTQETADLIVVMLRAGNYVQVAARAAGISRQTFHDWMRLGRSLAPKNSAYRDLRLRCDQARAEGEARLVAQIANAAATSWQAAAWLLERQDPARWGRVSVRMRESELPALPAPVIEPEPETGAFHEVDELARVRSRHQPA